MKYIIEEEFRVGDEVEHGESRGFITLVAQDHVVTLDTNTHTSTWPKEDCRKTGRRAVFLKEILESMKL